MVCVGSSDRRWKLGNFRLLFHKATPLSRFGWVPFPLRQGGQLPEAAGKGEGTRSETPISEKGSSTDQVRLVNVWIKNKNLFPSSSEQVFCCLVQQSCEKIDRTRAHAGGIFAKLLYHRYVCCLLFGSSVFQNVEDKEAFNCFVFPSTCSPEVPHIPHRQELCAIFKEWVLILMTDLPGLLCQQLQAATTGCTMVHILLVFLPTTGLKWKLSTLVFPLQPSHSSPSCCHFPHTDTIYS